MKRKNSLFLSSVSSFGDSEGVEIAMEMAPGEPLRLSPELITEHIIMSEYAMICRDPIDGLYTVPSARNKFGNSVYYFFLHMYDTSLSKFLHIFGG
ncbi:unnamed protein product, partial [Onchocerca flexuosa]|uniref:Uncharacterized protein n=1 Tax=Onchocerca flexuosa TaxID=387005 RepID=A0A183H682_9BILA